MSCRMCKVCLVKLHWVLTSYAFYLRVASESRRATTLFEMVSTEAIGVDAASPSRATRV